VEGKKVFGLRGVGGQTSSKGEGFEELDRVESAVREVLGRYLSSNEYYEELVMSVYYIDGRDRVLVVVMPNVTKDVPNNEEDEYLRGLMEELANALEPIGFMIESWFEGSSATKIVLARVDV